VRTYTEAVQWFAAAHLIPRTVPTRWDQVQGHDVRRWMVWLLGLYSDAYASNQYRALQQFFKWLAEEGELPDPMTRLHPPVVTEKLVPVFTSEETIEAAAGLRCPSSARDVRPALKSLTQSRKGKDDNHGT
jgi:site-specific recombinase XerD